MPKNRHQYTINCPFCVHRVGSEDTGNHMGIDPDRKIYHCFRCEAKPSVTGPLNRVDSSFDEEVYQSFSDDSSFFNLFKSVKKLSTKKEILDLERISVPISELATPMAWRYMAQRNFSPLELSDLDVRVGIAFYDDDGKLQYKWRNRVLFPFKEGGKVRYIVGRSVDGRDPKYINTKGSKAAVVWGADSIQEDAIICEGIISACAATRATGLSSVAILGKSISDWQVSKIARKCKKAYLCLDGDVDISEVAKKLLMAGLDVYHVQLPGSLDPDETPKDEFVRCIEESQRLNFLNVVYRFGAKRYENERVNA